MNQTEISVENLAEKSIKEGAKDVNELTNKISEFVSANKLLVIGGTLALLYLMSMKKK